MMDLGFRKGDSLFTPGYKVWTKQAAEDLKARFIDAPDMGTDTFMVKFKKQLEGGPRATVQLAAELLYVYLLPPVPSDFLPQTKLKLLSEILSWSPEPVTVPDELVLGLREGFAGIGTAYNTYRDRQLAFVIRVLLALRGLDQSRAEAALGDPWKFRSAVYSVEVNSANSMRNALLHLAFPDTFEDIVSDRHKELIRAAFKDLVPDGAHDVDEALLGIHQALDRELGRPISFYDDDVRDKWEPPGPPPLPPPPPPPGGALPDATQQLAQELLIDRLWLNETIDLLREKRQLILYGPPGTGKTFLAQALAGYLADATGGGYQLVQFHPSYSYEDFFEGFRPTPGDHGGTISFQLEPGPFKMLAQQAAAHPGQAHILVIDEINRANLAKVFGELYFLLEYRDREVSLQYSPKESFQLPDNLYVIGTMNTSDRSIALVDAAMRRRFNWQALFPDQPPVKDLLRRWLKAHNLDERAASLLDALNARIEGKDGKVGPSYLMTERARDDLGIRRIWEHQILPLLEERHAGEGVEVRSRYGVDALTSPQAVLADPWPLSAPVEQEAGEPPT